MEGSFMGPEGAIVCRREAAGLLSACPPKLTVAYIANGPAGGRLAGGEWVVVLSKADAGREDMGRHLSTQTQVIRHLWIKSLPKQTFQAKVN